MTKRYTKIWQAVLFSTIFLLIVFGIFGMNKEQALALTENESCKNTYGKQYGELNVNAVSRSSCDDSKTDTFACLELQNNQVDTINFVCKVTANADGTQIDPSSGVIADTLSGSLDTLTNGALRLVEGVTSPVIIGAAVLLGTLSAIFLGIAGLLLNEAIIKTVIGMPQLVRDIGIISDVWAIFRDIANILFIFLILYIAIATILNIQQYSAKNLLSKVIIAALLINFSLFFTRAIIDVSNVTTQNFYNQITVSNTASIDSVDNLTGVSGEFMSALNITTFFEDGAADLLKLTQFSTAVSVSGISIFMLIATFVFFVMALLLIIRFILFIILMITSPIGFVGGLLPATKGLSQQWWKTLWDQALFAPAFMLFLYVDILIIRSPGFQRAFTDPASSQGFQAAFSGSSLGDGLTVILNFSIVIGLLITSIVVSKSMASTGSGKLVDTASKWGSQLSFGAAALAGRQATGRTGQLLNAVGVTDALKRVDAGGGKFSGGARLALRGGRTLGTSSFDARNLGAVQGALGKAGIGKGGKGGFIDRQEAAKEKEAKAAEERMKQSGVASSETNKTYADLQSELRKAESTYARTKTTENEEKLNQARALFNKQKDIREAEIQESRARASQHDADSNLGGIWAWVKGGGGAVEGRQEGLGKARDVAEKARNKAGLDENKKRLEELEKKLGGDPDKRIKDAQKELEESEKKLTQIEQELKESTGNRTVELYLNEQREEIKEAIETLSIKRKTAEELKTAKEYVEYSQLKNRVAGATKQKQKDDLNNALKKSIEEQNKDKGGADSENKEVEGKEDEGK
jgi:hypothetical protein